MMESVILIKVTKQGSKQSDKSRPLSITAICTHKTVVSPMYLIKSSKQTYHANMTQEIENITIIVHTSNPTLLASDEYATAAAGGTTSPETLGWVML